MKGPLAENYEDQIIIDEMRRKMDGMAQELKDSGVELKTKFYNDDEQKKADKYAIEAGIPANYIRGRWSYDTKNNVVNAPRTPNLFNAIAMAEETEHALNMIPQTASESERGPKVSQRYIEEKRAKENALKRIGGLTPFVKENFDKTLEDYAKRYKEDVAIEQDFYNEYKNIKNPQSKSLFEDNYIDPEIKAIFDYYNKKQIEPKNYFKMLHPKLFENN